MTTPSVDEQQLQANRIMAAALNEAGYDAWPLTDGPGARCANVPACVAHKASTIARLGVGIEPPEPLNEWVQAARHRERNGQAPAPCDTCTCAASW